MAKPSRKSSKRERQSYLSAIGPKTRELQAKPMDSEETKAALIVSSDLNSFSKVVNNNGIISKKKPSAAVFSCGRARGAIVYMLLHSHILHII